MKRRERGTHSSLTFGEGDAGREIVGSRWRKAATLESCHTRFSKETKCYLYVCQDLVPYI
jgi:hypothetical protein